MNTEFYCIKVIGKDGTRGWVADTPNGLTIVIGGVNSDITQFATEQDANKFIKECKLERSGIKAYVRTNQELMEEEIKLGSNGISVANKPMYYLENQNGEKCFYDSKEEVYFFKQMGELGFPIWDNEDDMRRFVREMKFEQPMIFMIKISGKDKNEKTLIQIYGEQKNDDGTFSKPEHIDIELDNYETGEDGSITIKK